MYQFRLVRDYGKRQEDKGFAFALQLMNIKIYALGLCKVELFTPTLYLGLGPTNSGMLAQGERNQTPIPTA